MASGSLVGGGGGEGSREKRRWAENMVYTRKSHKPSVKPNNATQTKQQKQQPPQPPLSSQQTRETTADDVNSSLHEQQRRQQLPRFDSAASDDDASSLNNNAGRRQNSVSVSNRDAVASGNHSKHHLGNQNKETRPLNWRKLEKNGRKSVIISLGSKSRHEVHELRRKLTAELDQVRAFVKKLKARELQLAAASSVPAPSQTGYTYSQLSTNDGRHSEGVKKAASPAPLRSQLNVSVAMMEVDNSKMEEGVDKEKRTPKANQHYRNSEFLLGKEKLHPGDSHKKSKAHGSKNHHASGEMGHDVPVPGKQYAEVMKKCTTLLLKLMKHKHGWVFNTPVDVEGLGLHDYFSIIKHPMDLGTVKTRLNKDWYTSPIEFAVDVRLTFQNAMTYNPKGHDVHIMAEQLSGIFEECWPPIEAEFAVGSYPFPIKKAPAPLDMRRIQEKSDSTTCPMVPDLTPKPVNYTSHVGRSPALKKPKVKDPHKRDMTYEEKQRLSSNLQSLPPEKLDNIVQIIRKRNSSLSQQDDEIEVDIDSVDAETLWELDRFVINYKKSLSKNKRKAELAILARAESGNNPQEVDLADSVPPVVEPPKESMQDMAGEKHQTSQSPAEVERKMENANRSSSSSSSTSDSGSSSSASDSESSSACGSDVAHSPST